MAGQIEDYRKEIFNFLRTVTIKFEPFAYSMGEEYMQQHGLVDPHGEWNPYYINLTGEYTDNDTRMTVYSIEEEREVPFDKNLKTNYPKTAALYRIPNKEYSTLEERYPGNVGLIRTIAYPTPDMDTVLAAPNFALLAYDESLLDVNEREDMIKCLTEFLDMVRVRWWVKEFDYEDMYAITFWCLLWQYLPLLLLTRRFLNIRTPNVHTFHIWEYLKSHGLGDYRDVLTNNQSLWLYRNIDYIRKNQGKTSNLTILAENLLDEVFVSLLDKDMYQESETKWNELRTNPVFLSYNYVSGELEKTESFDELNDRLVAQGLEHRDDADYVDDTETALGTQNHNILPTKFLEFKKDPVNTANETLMYNFFIDTLMYRYSTNDLSFNCEVTDSINGSKLKLFVGDTILLWHWAIAKYSNNFSENLPTKFKVHLPFSRQQVMKTDLPEKIYYGKNVYKLNALMEVDNYIKVIDWHPRAYSDQTDFITTTADQLRDILNWNRQFTTSNRLQYHLALKLVERKVLVQDWVEFNWGAKKTFTDWRNSSELIDATLSAYEQRNSVEDYANLADACLDALFPLDDATLDEFLGSLRNMEKIYASIRDLFVRLCSYNVTYLETDRETRQYLQIDDPDTASFTTLRYYLGTLRWVFEDYDIEAEHLIHAHIPSVDAVHQMEIKGYTIHQEAEVPVHYHVDVATAHHSRGRVQHDVDICGGKKVFKLHLPIYVDDTNVTMRG